MAHLDIYQGDDQPMTIICALYAIRRWPGECRHRRFPRRRIVHPSGIMVGFVLCYGWSQWPSGNGLLSSFLLSDPHRKKKRKKQKGLVWVTRITGRLECNLDFDPTSISAATTTVSSTLSVSGSPPPFSLNDFRLI